MTFGQKLRQLREAAGLSEAKLAEASGVPFGTLHNYGQGIRKPTLAAALKLARALRVSTDVFAACDDLEEGRSSSPAKGKRSSSKRTGKST
jgi:transcriptional regulator with XRE-family HTH domain